MPENDYKSVRDRAKRDLRAALKNRNELDTKLSKVNSRIVELSKAVNALNLLVGDADEDDVTRMIEVSQMTLAEAMRDVLRQSDIHLTALEIHRELRRLGFQSADYTNPQASIHTMLRRLEESGQADRIIKDGKPAYRLLPV